MCLPDAVAQALGVAWPGCACTYISAQAAAAAGELSEQAAQALVAQSQGQAQGRLSPDAQQLLQNLTGQVNGTGLSYGVNQTMTCPAGFRCSRYGFLHLTPQLQRRGMSVLNGICTPCLVGEFCPNGTTELTTQVEGRHCPARFACRQHIVSHLAPDQESSPARARRP